MTDDLKRELAALSPAERVALGARLQAEGQAALIAEAIGATGYSPPSAETMERPMVLKVKDVARLLDMGERQVREAMKRGELPGVRIGDQWRVGYEALHRHINDRLPGPGH